MIRIGLLNLLQFSVLNVGTIELNQLFVLGDHYAQIA